MVHSNDVFKCIQMMNSNCFLCLTPKFQKRIIGKHAKACSFVVLCVLLHEYEWNDTFAKIKATTEKHKEEKKCQHLTS